MTADTAQLRRDLDTAIAAAIPHAGGRVLQCLTDLQQALTDLDRTRATAPAVVPAPTGTTDKPGRIKLHRTGGWKKPDGVVNVARPTKWGNPWKVGSTSWTVRPGGLADRDPHPPLTAAEAVESYRNSVYADLTALRHIREELRGKTLACWCDPDDPCHADVLLEVANSDLLPEDLLVQTGQTSQKTIRAAVAAAYIPASSTAETGAAS